MFNEFHKHILNTVDSNTKDLITNDYHLCSYLKIIGKAFNTVFYYFYAMHAYIDTYYQHGFCLLKNVTGSVMMQWTHLEPMTDIWHQLLSTKGECLQGGGGGRLWEGGDTLERLS